MKRYKVALSLGLHGDSEINGVIDNLHLFPKEDKLIIEVRPFKKGEYKDIKVLRENHSIVQSQILSSIQEGTSSVKKNENCKIQIALIGHKHKNNNKEYFGALQSSEIPVLQKKIYNILLSTGIKMKELEFKYYVCGAYPTLKEMQSEMCKLFDDTKDANIPQSVIVRASPKEIVPNPVFYNLRIGLKPEANKHKSKYLHRAIPAEHQAPSNWLEEVSCFNRRVIASDMPQEFKAKNLKTSEGVSHVAKLFKNKENSWKQFQILD